MRLHVCFFALAATGLVACGNGQGDVPPKAAVASNAAASATAANDPQVAPVTDKKSSASDHNYSMQDGDQYGYESAVSQNQEQDGQGTSPLVMFRYAGLKDGKYQLFAHEQNTYEVMECTNPCKFIKAMTFVDGEHVHTEHVPAVEGTVADAAMNDAIAGKLERAKLTSNATGEHYYVWFDERNGKLKTPAD